MAASNAAASTLSPEYALLGFLSQHPAHGYELHQRLAHDLGQIWHVSLSQTYNILKRLEARGFVAGTLQEQDKLPARRRFSLTAAGRRRFHRWLESPARSSVRAVRIEFVTRLYFARLLSPDTMPQVFDAQAAEIRAGLDRLRARAAALPPEQVFNHLGLDLRIRQLQSLLDWLGQCRATLEQHA